MPTTAPLDHSRGGSILRGNATWELDQYALFDRIINLRFIRANGEPFTLRSDYEVVQDADGNPHFIKCRQKPQIGIRYTQVSQNVGINVEIRITNLHILNETADNTIFSQAGDPITQVEVQMGYRNQFPDWTKPPYNADTDSEERLRLFYSLERFQASTADDRSTGLLLSVRVLSIQPESMPPDRVILIQGIVGTFDFGFRWSNPATTILGLFTAQNEAGLGDVWTNLDNIFFTYITRRFIRSDGITYRVDEEERALYVLDYVPSTDGLTSGTWLTDEQKSSMTIQERWSDRLSMPDGLLSIGDAIAIGVLVSMSPRARQLNTPELPQASSPVQQLLDNANTILATEFSISSIPFQQYIRGQMFEIKTAYPNIRWTDFPGGNIHVYDVREQSAETALITGDTARDSARSTRSRSPLLLPAVYDISIGALRVIRCPFVGFVSSGQRVGFSSRYHIGDLVGFFYPNQTDAWYMIILADIEFNTVEDKNEMVLRCVDIAPPNPEDPYGNEEAIAIQQSITAHQVERVLRWTPLTITGAAPFNAWSNILNSYVLRNTALRESGGDFEPFSIPSGARYGVWIPRAAAFLQRYDGNAWIASSRRPRDATLQAIMNDNTFYLPALQPNDVVYVPSVVVV